MPRTVSKGKKSKSTCKVLVEYKIRKGKARQQWFARSYLSTVFGLEQSRAARDEWVARTLNGAEGELGTGEAEEGGFIKASGFGQADRSAEPGISEYEAERNRNIDENRELMKSLGLCVTGK